jgi:hypothetical protein
MLAEAVGPQAGTVNCEAEIESSAVAGVMGLHDVERLIK